jgi:hypothetical protein
LNRHAVFLVAAKLWEVFTQSSGDNQLFVADSQNSLRTLPASRLRRKKFSSSFQAHHPELSIFPQFLK